MKSQLTNKVVLWSYLFQLISHLKDDDESVTYLTEIPVTHPSRVAFGTTARIGGENWARPCRKPCRAQI